LSRRPRAKAWPLRCNAVRSSSWRSKRAWKRWPHARAVPQRALLLLSDPPVRPAPRCPRRARIRG
jgi:hypothetical protein